MKKILVLVSLLCYVSLASAADLTVSVSDLTGPEGGTAKVPIDLAGAKDVGSMDIVLKYDGGILKAISVEAGDLGKNALIEANTAKENEITIALADSSGINGDGQVAIISFEVTGNVGQTSPLTFEKVAVNDINLIEVITTTKDGKLTVSEGGPLSSGTGTLMLAIAAVIIAVLIIRKSK
jgi:hypothetical protein